ncbi:23172_t:CDS:2 [Dentiscutata erythropus]|uniref:23172_t:CDS:1 n=1 Tax=Dentiscutata erythropus TaxID=1348616 RepID=A0A9N9NEL8_9GLOM|nr:23172_t:CDS:2 [Dentiscutata erythropus]
MPKTKSTTKKVSETKIKHISFYFCNFEYLTNTLLKAPSDPDNNKASGDHDKEEAPGDHNNSKGHHSKVSLINAFDNLEVFSDKSSNVLAELDGNISKKNGQKKENKSVRENLKNKDFFENFLTGNTFNNCTFNF